MKPRNSAMASLLGPSHAPLLSPATWLKEREDNTYGELELLMFASINNDWFGHVKQIFNSRPCGYRRASIVLNITDQGIQSQSPMVYGMAALHYGASH